MIDGLTHESAHAYLFSLSLGDSFVDNPDDELHAFALAALIHDHWMVYFMRPMSPRECTTLRVA